MSLTSLVQDEPHTFSLPIWRRSNEKRKDAGTLIVTLTSQDFTGLVGVTRSLNEVEKRLRDDVLRLGSEVDDLKKVRESLQLEVGKMSAENEKYERLNGELRDSVGRCVCLSVCVYLCLCVCLSVFVCVCVCVC